MLIKRFLLLFLISLSGAQASPQSEDNDEWNYSLALQAATWGSPLVTMYALRYHDALSQTAKAPPNTIWRMSDILTPQRAEEAGYTTPEVNVIYGFGFMDLRQEPIVLSVPNSEGRYYKVQIVDMWTNAFAYVGGTATGYQGGTFVLVGPNWKGDLPPNIQRIDCPTPWVLVQPCVHVYKEKVFDLPGAKEVLAAVKLEGLSTYLGKGAPPPLPYEGIAPDPVDPKLSTSVLNYKDPLQFWEILNLAMNENPPPQEQITALLPLFQSLGIGMGISFDRSKLSSSCLQAMKQAAMDVSQILAEIPYGILYRGAAIPPSTVGNFGTDYKTRAIMARIDLTVDTPQEAVTWMYLNDNQGAPLTGKTAYTLTFQKGIPFYKPGFWSLTLYSQATNYPIVNPINRYMVGSDLSQLKKNPDGSLTIYIQSTNPGKDKETNWLPSPVEPFYLVAMVYAPEPSLIQVLSNTWGWTIPAIQVQGGKK